MLYALSNSFWVGIVFAFIIVYLTITIVHRIQNDLNASEEHLQRRYKLTLLENIAQGVLLFGSFFFGLSLILLIPVPFPTRIIFILIGLSFLIDFLLYINYILIEQFQEFNLNGNVLEVNTLFSNFEIDLSNHETKTTLYKAIHDKEYGTRNWQLPGATYSKLVIKNQENTVSISSLRNIDWNKIINKSYHFEKKKVCQFNFILSQLF